MACVSKALHTVCLPVRQRLDRLEKIQRIREIEEWIENDGMLAELNTFISNQNITIQSARWRMNPWTRVAPVPAPGLLCSDWQFQYKLGWTRHNGMIRLLDDHCWIIMHMDWVDFNQENLPILHSSQIKQFTRICSLPELRRVLFETDWKAVHVERPDCMVFLSQWVLSPFTQ